MFTPPQPTGVGQAAARHPMCDSSFKTRPRRARRQMPQVVCRRPPETGCQQSDLVNSAHLCKMNTECVFHGKVLGITTSSAVSVSFSHQSALEQIDCREQWTKSLALDSEANASAFKPKLFSQMTSRGRLHWLWGTGYVSHLQNAFQERRSRAGSQ